MQQPVRLNPLEPIVGERLSWDGLSGEQIGSLVKSPPWANTALQEKKKKKKRREEERGRRRRSKTFL